MQENYSFLTNPRILFAISIYVGWYACVYLGQQGLNLVSLIVPVITWALMYKVFRLNSKQYLKLAALFITGLCLDSAAAYFGVIQFHPELEILPLPIWLISLWLVFVSSLPLLGLLFGSKYALAALLGAIFGPLSYRAGIFFGTLSMNGTEAIIIYAVYWAAFIPLALSWLNSKGDSNEH